MTTYDDMRGYIHVHDRNGWFDVVTETTPMYQMVDKAETENAQLRQQLADVNESMGRVEERCAKLRELAKKLKACNSSCGRCIELYGICEHETELRELRVEVDA